MCSILFLAMLLLICLNTRKQLFSYSTVRILPLGNGSVQLPDIPLNKLSYWHIESTEFITLNFYIAFQTLGHISQVRTGANHRHSRLTYLRVFFNRDKESRNIKELRK